MSPEQPHDPLNPDQLLAIKDDLLSKWNQLPPEHQATMVLVLVHQTLEGEYGAWLAEALPGSAPLFPVEFNRIDLDSILTPEESAKLTDQDLKEMAHEMEQHFTVDWFWDELEAAARRRLADKE